MIEEAYVTIETARLLEKKGFKEYCPKAYSRCFDGRFENAAFSEWGKMNQFPAPTQQVAMRWLREVYNICCEICCYREKDESGFVFCFLVLPLNSQAFYQTSNYSTYEDATEAAIKYCLEHLIG